MSRKSILVVALTTIFFSPAFADDGCDPTFGCPTGVPNGGVGCDPTFGCPTGVPNNGVGCDPVFGCPTGSGGTNTINSTSGELYVTNPSGSLYNNSTGESFYPVRRGNEIIGYSGSNGTTLVLLANGGLLSSNGEYLTPGTLSTTPTNHVPSNSPAIEVRDISVGDKVRVRTATNVFAGIEIVDRILPGVTFSVYLIEDSWVALKAGNGKISKGWVQKSSLVKVAAD